MASSPSPRLPTNSDFPPSVQLEIVPPPGTQPPLNVLVLLHGLGDTETPFTSFGRALNLPSTACISVRAPAPIPALFTGSDAPSFHWGDDLLIDSRTGDIDVDAGFAKATALLWGEIVSGALVRQCGFALRDVMFLGFGQGAMPVLELAARRPEVEFGGVVAIAARLPASVGAGEAGKAKTPVLLLGGSRSGQVTRSAVDLLKSRFVDVEYVRSAKAEDSMPANREEILPVMRFLARRLKSRAGVPEGAIELS